MTIRLLGILILLCGTLGCPADDDNPNLPPASTLTANVETLKGAPQAAKNANITTPGDYQNFANAWLRVQIVNAAAVGIIAIPTLTLHATTATQPTFAGGTWTWQTTIQNTNNVTVELIGSLLLGWNVDMTITNSDLTDFLWVDGQFSGDRTSGTWTLHDPDLPLATNEVLTVGWEYTDDTHRQLAYSNVNAQSADMNDVMTWSIADTTAMLAFTDADNVEGSGTIQWDTTTGVGWIEVPEYNNGDKACWDTEFKNTTCQ